MKQFEEKFGKRVLVNCNDLSFNLQSCVAENEEGPTTNVRMGTIGPRTIQYLFPDALFELTDGLPSFSEPLNDRC